MSDSETLATAATASSTARGGMNHGSERKPPRNNGSRADHDRDWRRGDEEGHQKDNGQSWRGDNQNWEGWGWNDRSGWRNWQEDRGANWPDHAYQNTSSSNSKVIKGRGKGRGGAGGKGRSKDQSYPDRGLEGHSEQNPDTERQKGSLEPEVVSESAHMGQQDRGTRERREGKGKGGGRRRIGPAVESAREGVDDNDGCHDPDVVESVRNGSDRGVRETKEAKGKGRGRRLIGPGVGSARDNGYDNNDCIDAIDTETLAYEEAQPKGKDIRAKQIGKGRGKDRQGGSHKKGKGQSANDADLTQTQTLYAELGKGTYECMICINKVRRHDPIWSCSNCFAALHIKCIHQWIRKSSGDSRGPEFAWSCPGCRYHFVDTLPEYVCFCGKMLEPQANPHILAHSCGEVCGRTRNCSHPCNELCHAGPCPPCTATGPPGQCHCGREAKAVTRCGDPSRWSCQSICGRSLGCGEHTCPLRCHAGPCPPCKVTSRQQCFCGAKFADRLCQEEAWDCGNPCGKLLDCGEHYCEQPCHPGSCGPCVRDPETWGDRCACGRTRNCKGEAAAALLVKWVGARKRCTDPLPLCGARCDRPFKGCEHLCTRTCHDGPCGICDKKILRECRCHKSKFETLCAESKSTLCTQVCRTKKSCGVHKCDVVCCPGYNDRNHEDHLCLQVCGKPLACGVHICEEFCHLGKCPPCRVTLHEPLCCACGMESIRPPVRCGTAPPRCMEICAFERSCGHLCTTTCHFGEHPLCCELVDRQCLGGHREMKFQPCHVGSISCGEKCGKRFECGHFCTTPCHGGDCPSPCTQPCGAPRVHCQHPCAAQCHPGEECEDVPCRYKVKASCPCGIRVEEQVCGAFSGRSKAATLVLKCGGACVAQSRIPSVDGIRVSPNAETYVGDIFSLARTHSKYILMLEERFINVLSSNCRTVLPPCDTNRRILAMEYARLHWRLHTITKRDTVEGWYVITIDATKNGRAPWPRLSEIVAGESTSSKPSSQLGSQPCLRFTGCKGVGDEIYDLVGLEDLLGVRPGQDQGEILAFVSKGSAAVATFRKLTSQEPAAGQAAPVSMRTSSGLQVCLENTLRSLGGGSRSTAKATPNTTLGHGGAWGKGAAPKAKASEVTPTPTAPTNSECVADSWEDM